MGKADWNTRPERTNVLIVGNGIDRLAGYNTDYLSFLKAHLSHYTKLINQHIDKKISELGYQNFMGDEELELPKKDLKMSIINKQVFADRNLMNYMEPSPHFYKKQSGEKINRFDMNPYFDKHKIISKYYFLCDKRA